MFFDAMISFTAILLEDKNECSKEKYGLNS
jgi:hypothetical protein